MLSFAAEEDAYGFDASLGQARWFHPLLLTVAALWVTGCDDDVGWPGWSEELTPCDPRHAMCAAQLARATEAQQGAALAIEDARRWARFIHQQAVEAGQPDIAAEAGALAAD